MPLNSRRTAIRLLSTLPRNAWKISRRLGAGPLVRAMASHWPFPTRTTASNGSEVYVNLRSGIGRGLFATGSFDMAAIQPILDELCPGSTMIDVGANTGFYSVLASTLVGDSGHIYAFEIDRRPLKCLRRTIAFQELRNIYIEEAAASDIDGSVTFVPADEHGHNHIERDGNVGYAVRSVRLDTWTNSIGLERLDAIKIDVEGAEKFVLEGARETINRFKPLIICEASILTEHFGYAPDELVTLFKSIEYRTVSLKNVWAPTLIARSRKCT